ncbi:helix-turn-helix domain-containing protein [Streptantibioticus rubrisoli]|uniref:Helix-turn-helix domain-containing protein n=1 Tax=Streptantibioticus rubrisoli TaxID=1387313 RepID=A0ABT1PIT9_9ACTN|nr:helix-turn-helix domain-containing protein [Streptantibioticus rubrisoli]MCQ4045278.1 helix-turn-helix domain-containing protein [Streptantibioticus rubrisoli]
MIRDLPDLGSALVELYEKAGAPSLRAMAQRAGAFGVLPRSTIERIIKRQTVPRTEEQLVAYLPVCEVPERDHVRWLTAWNRARGYRSRPPRFIKGGWAQIQQALLRDLAAQYTGPDFRVYEGPLARMERCPHCHRRVSIRRVDSLDYTECPDCGVGAVLGQPKPAERLMTVAEAAAMLNCSKVHVFRLVHEDLLPAARTAKSGSAFRIPERAVAEYRRRLDPPDDPSLFPVAV